MSKFLKTLNHLEKEILTEMAYGYGAGSQPVTKTELMDVIRNITSPDAPVKFTTITEAAHYKGAKNTLGTPYKVSQIEGKINIDYARRKIDVMAKELPGATYQPGKTWGSHETGSIVVQKDDTGQVKGYYLAAAPEKTEPPRFVIKDNLGKFSAVDKQAISSILKTSTSPGVAEVAYRRWKMENIVALEVDGKSYQVSDVSPEYKEILDIVSNIKPL